MGGTRPKALRSFNYERVGTIGANTAKIILFDPEWDKIEGLLQNGGWRNIELQYGYTTGLRSPKYKLVLMGYLPTFSVDGCTLDLTCISAGFHLSPKVPRLKSKTWGDKRISEIVEDICGENGWAAEVDRTQEVYDNHDLEESGLVRAHFTQNKLSDLQFIAEVLQPRAIREKDKAGDYRLFFDDATNKLHFHPPTYDKGPEKIYTYRMERTSEVISWQPRVDGFARILRGAGVSALPYVDTQTGDYGNSEFNDADTPEKTLLGGQFTITSQKEEEFYHAVEGRPVRDKDQADAIARSRYYTELNDVYGGVLEIVGDPSRLPGTNIKILVLKPNGALHYTTGLYHIMKITDSMSSGVFKSTLELQRNAFSAQSGVTGDPGTGKVNN